MPRLLLVAAAVAAALAGRPLPDDGVRTDAWRTTPAAGYLVSHPGSWQAQRATALRLRAGRATVWVVDGQAFHGDVGRADPATRRAVAAVVESVRALQPVRWRQSRSLGRPDAGRLVGGVQLPAEGVDFFTWDPVRRAAPNRPWRRFGHNDLVRLVLQVLAEHRRAHPHAPRVGIGDLSRPRGGDFGRRFGLPGHVSHQNGLDVDVYYPRLDRRERVPERPSQIDRVLAQDIVDRFVRAGAVRVFVGPRTGLRGDPRVVQPLALHDNHLHVRVRQ